MEVTTQTIEYLANLSKLQFDATQTESIQKDLQNMIAFIEKLQEVDTTGVEPLMHMSDAVNAFRNDHIEGSVSSQSALLNSPIPTQDFFRVPTVIKK